MDFDKSGLGIGGAGRHSLEDEMAELIAKGELISVEQGRQGPMPNGQLWEPCARWGCDEEPVCLDCGYCERHCKC
jgi:hypothetical protein